MSDVQCFIFSNTSSFRPSQVSAGMSSVIVVSCFKADSVEALESIIDISVRILQSLHGIHLLKP